MKFIDLFAGIGGFRLAFENLGAKCVFSSEIDKHACKTYEANFGEVPNGDITKIDAKNIPSFDILCAGFPCQPFSIAGKRKGLEDPRGNLFDEIIRIADYHQPKVLFLENVKGLVNHDKGETFRIILNKLSMLGYHIEHKVLKASDYGLPTLRPRLYIIAFKSWVDHVKFQWPDPIPLTKNVGSILEDNVHTKYSLSDKLWGWHKFHKEKEASKKNGFGYRMVMPVSPYTGTLTARYYKDGKEILLEQKDFYTYSDIREGDKIIHSWDLIETTQREKEICLTILRNRRKKEYGDKDGNALHIFDINKLMPIEQQELDVLCSKKILRKLSNFYYVYDFVNSAGLQGINGIYKVYLPGSKQFSTLTTQTHKNEIVLVNDNPRKLTPKECARLMGFPDSFKIVVSDNQAYKQFGNSVAVPVIEAIGKEIMKINK